MSEKRHPDWNREDEKARNRDDKSDSENEYEDDVRLWGAPEEDESYGDARDKVFQAGTTSRPGSMGKSHEKNRAWQGQDAQQEPHEAAEDQPDQNQQARREQAIRRTTKNNIP